MKTVFVRNVGSGELNKEVAFLSKKTERKLEVVIVILSVILLISWSGLLRSIAMSELKNSYNSLNETYQDYKTLHTHSNFEFHSLSSILYGGKAIAKSATWLSEERLEVTSELMKGKYSDYNVKVTVTNVGSEALASVWIFFFPYVDEKLVFITRVDEKPVFQTRYTHSFESLYIGETHSHTFTWVPDEMTSYKVLAVAGSG